MIGFIIGFIMAIILVIIIAIQSHDKDYRRQNDLPPRRYHSVVDHDPTIVYTVERRRR